MRQGFKKTVAGGIGRACEGIAAFLLVAALPQTAAACAVQMAICTTPSTGLDARFMTDSAYKTLTVGNSFVVLQDQPGGKDGRDLILLNCATKTSLVVGAAALGSTSPGVPADIMERAMNSKDVVTFPQLRKMLKAEGYASTIGPITADHCACGDGAFVVDNSCAQGG